MEKTFKNICKKDIGEILEMINDYLPDLEKWHLEQSTVFGENKRIICRSVKDKDNKKLGYDIRIHVNDVEKTFFHFRYIDNGIFLVKKIWKNEKPSILNIIVSLNNGEITRNVNYKNEEGIISHEERYNINNYVDLQSYLEAESLRNIVNDLRNEYMVRKRK